MRTRTAACLTACMVLLAGTCASLPEAPEGAPLPFRELWGYLMKGDEKELIGSEPLTDLCYLGATISAAGALKGSPGLPALKRRRDQRLHLLINDLTGAAFLHHCMTPNSECRERLVKEIVYFAEPYDGVQMDCESVLPEDARIYHAFLLQIRQKLPEKTILSVAVPARRKKLPVDAFDYEAIASVADRVIVMAYDQHWSTGEPGPVASLPWCREVLAYAKRLIPPEKLVMGMSLYGRAWQDKRLNQAMRHRTIEEQMRGRNITPSYSEEEGLHYEYSETVRVKVYYDDTRTLWGKLGMYRSEGVRAVSFWRIGQGPEGLWGLVRPAD